LRGSKEMTQRNSLVELENELRALRETTAETKNRADEALRVAEKFMNRDSNFMAGVSLLVAIIAAVSGYFVYDNSVRTRENTERAEKRVEQLSGEAIPDRLATLYPVGSADGSKFTFEYVISPEIRGGFRFYSLTLQGYFHGTTIGPAGRLIGNEVRFSGPILDFAAGNSEGRVSSVLSALYSDGDISLEQIDGGTPIAENGTFQIRSTIYKTYTDCLSAEKSVQQFIELNGPEAGLISIRPIFLNIANPPKINDFGPFHISVVAGSAFSCDLVEALEEG
jgi:hypothetical protein